MLFPIQAAPIDRSNRALTVHARTSGGGIAPQQPNVKEIICTICKILPLPPPFGAICPIICALP